jgi:N-methylhydantoinase A
MASRASARSRASIPTEIKLVMHGTTVATNAVLTGRGARVGLVTTAGYEDTLQVARSFCPGGLGGWVSYIKSPLLAPLELTIGAKERIGADGEVVTPLDEAALRADLEALHDRGEHRGADYLLHQRLHQRDARAPRGRDRP